jgi:hypothetical protein
VQKVFATLNDLVSKGVVSDYALGGSVGFMVYTQPFLTDDTDFFVTLASTGLLLSLTPIYEYAATHGFPLLHEHIVIDGESVQIIPAPSPLFDEAIATAQTRSIVGESVRVMLPEYLICTALAAGRLKDFTKIEKLLGEATVCLDKLKELIAKFKLQAAWERYHAALGPTDPAFGHLAATKLAWRSAQAKAEPSVKFATVRKLRARSQQIRYRGATYRPV